LKLLRFLKEPGGFIAFLADFPQPSFTKPIRIIGGRHVFFRA
jgi:hypothetical protein